MTYLFGTVLAVALLALSWVDFRTFRLPNIITFPLIGVGVVQAWVLSGDWKSSVIGAVIGYAAFVMIEVGFRTLRQKDGLGRGDAKLLAAGGAWCGWIGLPFIVLIASGSGLIALLFPSMRKKADTGRIPFGPFLAFGICLVWVSFTYAG